MRKLCLFVSGFAAAVLTAVNWLTGSAAIAAGIAAGIFAAALFGRKRKMVRRAAILLLGASAGLLWCSAYRGLFLRQIADVDGSVAPVKAVVLEAPRDTRYGKSVLCDVDWNGSAVRSVLYTSDQTAEPEAGDTITCDAKLVRGEEKNDTYYSGKGVWLVGTVKGEWTVTKGTGSAAVWPARLCAALGRAADAIFPADVAGFWKGMLFGDRSGMDSALRNELSIAGIYHAVAVSGMHVSILFGMILLLCGGNRTMAAAIGLPVVAVFVMMTGASASSVRAGAMLVLLMIAPLMKRENDPATSLAAALLLLLIANPWAILDIGLQLSFASTAGILFFSGRIYRSMRLPRGLTRQMARRNAAGWLLRAALSALCCSLASMVFSLPLAALHFGMVSLAALVVNPLCLWAISILFTGGLLLCPLGLVWPWLAAQIGWLLAWLARYVLGIVRLAAKVPFAAVYLENVYWWLFAAALYGTVVLLAAKPEAIRKWKAAALVAAAFAVCLGCAAIEYRAAEFTFTMLDVGQGQCLIFQADGEATVIDCGGVPDESGETAARYLQSYGVFQIDNLVLTHYDSDHVNGAIRLLTREKVGTLWLPDSEDESGWRDRLLAAAAERGCRTEFVRQDAAIAHGVTLFAPVSAKNGNDAGVCCLASAGEYDILITGDLSQFAEYRLLSLHALPEAELLVAGHHGADSSTSAALLELVNPETVAISVGAENRYGHPAAETLERIAEIGAEVYRTDLQGTITIRG